MKHPLAGRPGLPGLPPGLLRTIFVSLLFLGGAAIGPVQAASAPGGKPGTIITPSGLTFVPLQAGTGPSPKAEDSVRVNYRGTFLDGREFDSSYKSGQPIEFPLGDVIPCWTEGVQLMKVGGRAQLTCPPGIAYGSRGAGGVIPPNATLRFEIELLGIVKR